MGEIILEKCYDASGKYLGKITIEADDLTKKISEIWSDTDLAPLVKQPSVLPLSVLREMTMIAFLKSDIAGKDVMGYRQYQKRLKEEGFDV